MDDSKTRLQNISAILNYGNVDGSTTRLPKISNILNYGITDDSKTRLPKISNIHPPHAGMISFKTIGNLVSSQNKAAKAAREKSLAELSQSSEAVCRIEDSPFRLLKVAGKARENLNEFTKAYTKDPSRVDITDKKGQRALHVAAAKGHAQIVEFIIREGADMNVVDNEGDTPLHLAARFDRAEVARMLVAAGADATILNKQSMAPLHVACDVNSSEVVKVLLTFPQVNLNIQGELGMRPLHYCGTKDSYECADKLLLAGADPMLKDDVGYYPVHIAAKSAAAQTLDVIISGGMMQGYTRTEMLNLRDKENNMPLHAAVNGGDLKAVEACVRAGASVSAQQDDKSTGVHLAAAQGNLEMIKLMNKLQPQNFCMAIGTTDVQDRTPLHRAAVFNHHKVVQYLLDEGADVDTTDKSDNTALLLAASKGCWETVQVLVNNNADMKVKDRDQRNFLHLAIRFGGRLQEFIGKKNISGLLDEKDAWGCTPLHYAAKEGHLQAISDLIAMGASVNPKNKEKQSPFHFAAKFGRFNTIRRLLDSDQGSNIINETDWCGMTALHHAAQNGHTKILTLLLQRGASCHRDHEDNTALHHAAQEGWTHSMKILLGIHSNLRDLHNNMGETALHVAAKHGRQSAVRLLLTMDARIEMNREKKTFFDYVIENKESEVAKAVVEHDRWEQVLQSQSEQYGSPFLGLIQQMPEICVVALDRCMIESDGDKQSKDYYIEYNFKFLTRTAEAREQLRKKGKYQALESLNAMVQYGRVDCLSHPVCVNFLKFKWKTYGLWLYIFFLTLYIIFLGSLTTIVINPGYYFRSVSGNFQGTGMGVHEGHMNETAAGLLPKGKLDPTATLMVDIVTVYSLLCIIRETLIMISRKARYFNDHSKLLQWISYTLCFLFTAPFTVNMAFSWQWEIGAMAVFFAWFNLLIILQRFDFFGIYVVMFLEILRTLLAALSVFSIVIVAFGLSFHMLMKNEVSMMTLEPDYAASFNNPYNDNDESTLPYGATTFLMLIFWVLLMPILLMNLLIGLAVGDIETVQKNANLKRLAGQVELHSDLENKMPLVMLARVEQYTQRHHPNISKNVFQKLLYRVAISDDVSEKSISSTDIKTDTIAEVLKQKQRLRETFALAEKNNQLLRLLARRFEIQTEDETWDEGPGPGERTRGSLSAGTQANFLGFETGAMRRPFLSPRRISGTFPQHGTGISTSPASPYGSEQHLGGVPPRTATSEPSHVPVRSTSEPKVNVSQNVPLRRTSSAPKAPMEERTATPESSSELNSEPTYSLWEESQPETDHSDSDQSESD